MFNIGKMYNQVVEGDTLLLGRTWQDYNRTGGSFPVTFRWSSWRILWSVLRTMRWLHALHLSHHDDNNKISSWLTKLKGIGLRDKVRLYGRAPSPVAKSSEQTAIPTVPRKAVEFTRTWIWNIGKTWWEKENINGKNCFNWRTGG